MLDTTPDELMNSAAWRFLGNGDTISPAIVVPTLTNFFKSSPSPVDDTDLRQYQVGIKSHTHPDTKIDGINIRLQNGIKTEVITYGNWTNSIAYIHHGNKNKIKRTIIRPTISLNLNQVTMPTLQTQASG